VLWLALPAPRAKGFVPLFSGVDAALRRAATEVAGVQVLALDDLLSPGFRYRSTLMVRGRRVKLHETDGIHLSAAGGSYVASLAIAALKARGIP
jgi:hypothetical protein